MCGGGFDLSQIFTQFGRNVVELQLGVNFFFRLARDRFLVFDAREAVFIERKAHFERALAQRYVVCLGTGEILHGRSEGLGRQQAYVHLHAVAVPEADLVVALRDDVHQAGKAQQMLGDLLPRLRLDAALARDQDVEVADGFASAAQRPGRRDFFNARNC